jgi:hypothetical protein
VAEVTGPLVAFLLVAITNKYKYMRAAYFLTLLAVALSPASMLAAEFELSGDWNAATTLPDGNESESVLRLAKSDGKWSGTAKGESGELKLTKVTIEGSDVVFELDIEVNGNELVFRVDAKAEGTNNLVGKWTANGADGNEVATGDWTAERDMHPLVGEWNATGMGPEGEKMRFPIVIQEEDDKLLAVLKRGEYALPADEVTLADKKLTLKVQFPFDGSTYPVTFTATLSDDGDQLAGGWVALNASGDEEASGDWKALRAGSVELAGAWTAKATLGDGTENSSVYHFEADGDDWKGKAVGDGGGVVFDKVTLDGKDLVVDMELPYDGSTIELRVKAVFDDAGAIVGKWIAFDDSGQEAATGDWQAARKTDS